MSRLRTRTSHSEARIGRIVRAAIPLGAHPPILRVRILASFPIALSRCKQTTCRDETKPFEPQNCPLPTATNESTYVYA